MSCIPNEATVTKWSVLLDKLIEFDQQTAPMGLYGVRDFNSPGAPHPPFKLEWEMLFKPVMKSLGCNPAKSSFLRPPAGAFHFQESSPVGYLRVLRLSKIKVRKYGSAFRVDPHHEFARRWKEAAIDSILNDAWKWRASLNSLILLFGFADEESPFSEELDALQTTQTFARRFRPALTRVWDDPHGRGFKVLAALWAIMERNKK